MIVREKDMFRFHLKISGVNTAWLNRDPSQ